MFSSAPHGTDLEFTETFEKEFFAGAPGDGPHTEIASPDAHLLEAAACGKPGKRETQTTYGQLCPA
jgi:hypothetical protein